jgi:hypothetical protein
MQLSRRIARLLAPHTGALPGQRRGARRPAALLQPVQGPHERGGLWATTLQPTTLTLPPRKAASPAPHARRRACPHPRSISPHPEPAPPRPCPSGKRACTAARCKPVLVPLWQQVFRHLMCSEPDRDSHRVKDILEAAIDSGGPQICRSAVPSSRAEPLLSLLCSACHASAARSEGHGCAVRCGTALAACLAGDAPRFKAFTTWAAKTAATPRPAAAAAPGGPGQASGSGRGMPWYEGMYQSHSRDTAGERAGGGKGKSKAAADNSALVSAIQAKVRNLRPATGCRAGNHPRPRRGAGYVDGPPLMLVKCPVSQRTEAADSFFDRLAAKYGGASGKAAGKGRGSKVGAVSPARAVPHAACARLRRTPVLAAGPCGGHLSRLCHAKLVLHNSCVSSLHRISCLWDCAGGPS